ncbi:beta-galactosidase, partial [Pseudomonas aeruginosa]
HTDFSSPVWHREAMRISTAVAARYGENPYVAGWQTDNELCCHNTAISASPAALAGFRTWCREQYADIAALNKAWG